MSLIRSFCIVLGAISVIEAAEAESVSMGLFHVAIATVLFWSPSPGWRRDT
jgi:hypothetical protein